MDSADDRRIAVSEETARLIREKVENGSFASAGEVVEAAMDAMARETEERAASIERVKARIRASVADLGPGYTSDEVFGEIRERLLAQASSGGFHEDPTRPLE